MDELLTCSLRALITSSSSGLEFPLSLIPSFNLFNLQVTVCSTSIAYTCRTQKIYISPIKIILSFKVYLCICKSNGLKFGGALTQKRKQQTTFFRRKTRPTFISERSFVCLLRAKQRISSGERRPAVNHQIKGQP